MHASQIQVKYTIEVTLLTVCKCTWTGFSWTFVDCVSYIHVSQRKSVHFIKILGKINLCGRSSLRDTFSGLNPTNFNIFLHVGGQSCTDGFLKINFDCCDQGTRSSRSRIDAGVSHNQNICGNILQFRTNSGEFKLELTVFFYILNKKWLFCVIHLISVYLWNLHN